MLLLTPGLGRVMMTVPYLCSTDTTEELLEALVMERADRARDLSDKRDTRVSSEIIRSSLFGMHYLSDKRDTRVSYITR